jgi:hypothetical protein
MGPEDAASDSMELQLDGHVLHPSVFRRRYRVKALLEIGNDTVGNALVVSKSVLQYT